VVAEGCCAGPGVQEDAGQDGDDEAGEADTDRVDHRDLRPAVAGSQTLRPCPVEADDDSLPFNFDRHLRLEFHGGRITSDGRILVRLELDDTLGLTDLAGRVLSDGQRSKSNQPGARAQADYDHAAFANPDVYELLEAANMTRPAEWVVDFYNHRGTAERWIKERKSDWQTH